MSFTVVLTQVVMLFLLILVGFAAGRSGVLRTSASKDLTALLLKVTLPALLFRAMIREMDRTLVTDSLWCVGLSLIFFVGALYLSSFVSKRMKLKTGRQSIWTLAGAFSNTGFIGFPVVSAIYGAEGLFLASMINISFNLVVYSFGAREVMKETGMADSISWKKVAFSNINIAIFVGIIFFFFQIPVPEVILSVTDTLGNVTTPLSMLVTGLNIADSNIGEIFRDKDVYTASLFRLILMPLLAFLLVLACPIREGSLVPGVFTMIVAMPCATICVLFAEQYGADRVFASRVVIMTSMLCMVTLPLVSLLF